MKKFPAFLAAIGLCASGSLAATKLLTIDSWPAGPPIGGSHPGTTPYTAYVEEGTAVEVVAPWHHFFSFMRGFFVQWKDGSGSTLSDRISYSFTITEDTRLFAEFAVNVRQFYVNDAIADGGVPPGDDANSGTSPSRPMASIQALLQRYGNAFELSSTVHVLPGTYDENIVMSHMDHLSIVGSGADTTFIDGGLRGACLTVRDSWWGFPLSTGLVSGFTFTGGLSEKGAGISCHGRSSLTIRNCVIAVNEAIEGGGIYCGDSSRPTLENCTIVRNSARSGGGIYCAGTSTLTIVNSIVWGSSADLGMQMAVVRTSPDSIHWVLVKWTNIEGGLGGIFLTQQSVLMWGDGNISVDPLFADPASNDFHLKSEEGRWKQDANGGLWVKDEVTSPCIDAGDPQAAFSTEPQPNASIVNMGAYGSTPHASLSPGTCTLTVVTNGFDAQFSGYPYGVGDFSSNVRMGPISLKTTWTAQFQSDGKAHPFFRWADADGNTLSWQGIYKFTLAGDTTLVAEYGHAQQDFYVNDEVPEGGFLAGDYRNAGTSPQAPMPSINTLLERYTEIEEGTTIHVSAGIYAGNVMIRSKDNSSKMNITLSGAGKDQTVIQGHASSQRPCLTLAGFSGIIKGVRFNGASGVCCIASSPLIEDCIIDASHQGNFGGPGGIYCDPLSLPMIRNSAIIGNAFPSGGGVLCDASSPIILSCIIRNNTGAGIACVNGAAPLIQGNIIEDNHPQEGYSSGSGVYCVASSPVIEGNVIAGNSNASRGGGIYADADSAPTISNNLIAGNQALTGGGLHLEGTASVQSCTIAGNTAESAGGGVAGNTAAVAITNSILWGNTAPSGPEIALTASSLAVGHSDVAGGIDGVAADEASGPVAWGEGCIDADPRFVDAPAGDYRLLPGSPCIDAGTNAGVPPGQTDAAGVARIIDGNFDGEAVIDLGAFEHLPGDLDRDGRVTILDLIRLRNSVGGDPASGGVAPLADVNADGQINIVDLVLVRGRMGR